MGGAGALRFALAHPDLFGAALVLSPAVYTPLPPADSNTRVFGAFGVGDRSSTTTSTSELNYPALDLHRIRRLPLRLFLAAGDAEWPTPTRRTTRIRGTTLYNPLRRVPA